MKAQVSDYGIDPKYLPSEALWLLIEPLLPEEPPKLKGGCPRRPDKDCFFAIFYVLRTGCQWKALPRSLGASSTVHDRFQQWTKAGVFKKLWVSGLIEYDTQKGIKWTWQALDAAMTKAPLGGENTGKNPTDRGKCGTKRHLLTDAAGIPIGFAASGANCHDKTQVKNVFDTMPILPPMPTQDDPQHACMDKGYDYADIHGFIGALGYLDHIKCRGQEDMELFHIPGYRARRWVVERTHSWLNRFRRLLIRWEKKTKNYEALSHLAFAFICFRNAGVFG